MDKTASHIDELTEMFKRDSLMSETKKLKNIEKDVERKLRPIHPKFVFGKMPKGVSRKTRGKYRKPNPETPT